MVTFVLCAAYVSKYLGEVIKMAQANQPDTMVWLIFIVKRRKMHKRGTESESDLHSCSYNIHY